MLVRGNESHRSHLRRGACRADRARLRTLPMRGALAVVCGLESLRGSGDPSARSPAARRYSVEVRARLAAGSLLRHRVRRGLVSVALASKRLERSLRLSRRWIAVQRVSGGVDACSRCDMAGPVPGIRLLRVLSAVSGCGRPLLALA